MKKTYISPKTSMLHIGVSAILSGSDIVRKYTGNEFTNDAVLGTGTATSGSTFGNGQGEGGHGNRAKGNDFFWDE